MINRRSFISKCAGMLSYVGLAKLSIGAPTKRLDKSLQSNILIHFDISTEEYEDLNENAHVIMYKGKFKTQDPDKFNHVELIDRVKHLMPAGENGYTKESIYFDVSSTERYISYRVKYVYSNKPICVVHIDGSTTYHDYLYEISDMNDILFVYLKSGLAFS